MANLLDSYGLDFLEETDELLMGAAGYVVSKGKTLVGCYGTPYVNMTMGDVELWIGTEKDEEGQLHVSSFHTHSPGNNVWEMICSGFDLTPKARRKTERVLILNRSTDDGGMLPVDIINADVLPGLLKGDRIKLQVVAPCLSVWYYASEDEYAYAQPDNKSGKKWLIADGALLPLAFLDNHHPSNYEKDKEYESDAYVTFKATVKALYHGTFEMEETRENTFIRCVADTQYGELEFHHSIEQVPEEMRQNIKIGSIISGVCILSADAAIEEYENGMVRDFDHDLRLLRYTLVKGQAERVRSILNPDSVYESEASGLCCHGADEIVDRLNFVAENREKEYVAHMAEITETDGADLEFPVGTKCLVLAEDGEDRYESIVFLSVDRAGNIARIKVSTDGRYHFRIERPKRIKTPLDDIVFPESVAEAIISRARYHGLLDESTEANEIINDANYASHAANAKRMLEALEKDQQPDATEAFDNILGYLFAKAVEMEVNEERENPTFETRLTASYLPHEALRGQLTTTLEPERHAALEGAMALARQFGTDVFTFMEMNGKTEDDFEDIFIQAAVVVQRIGQLYAENGF